MKNILLFFTAAGCLFANAQNYQWAKTIGAAVAGNLPSNARCVITDAAGNVYMTGNFKGTNVDFNPFMSPVTLSSGANADIFFAKYASTGNCIWAKSIQGSSGWGYSIITDASGNVYLTGIFSGTSVDFDPGPGTAPLTSQGTDIFIAKYDAGGNFVWAKAMGGASSEFGMSIQVDASYNIFITGRFQSPTVDFDPGPGTANLNSAGMFDIYFAKYDPNGNYLWAKTIGSNGNDISNSISIDNSGNVYITGYFQGAATDFDPGPGTATLSSSGSDIFFAKYDTNGNYVWAKSIFGSSSGSGQSISVDAVGNTYLSGNFQGSNVDFDPGPGLAPLNSGTTSAMFFAKYNTSGNYLWAKSVPGATGYAITHNTSGKIYITGTFGANVDFDPGPGTATINIGGSGDIFFSKYDVNGNYIWAKSIANPSTSNDYVNTIAVDLTDNIYIAGTLAGTNIDFDPANSTATLTTGGYYNMYLAKYAFCSVQAVNQQTVCSGSGYAINSHTYTVNGSYNDTLYTAFGCDSIVVTQLTISSQQPTMSIISSSVLCSGSANTLTASGAITYTWSTGAQTAVVVITPTNATQYFVSGTDSGGCIASATINVTSTPSLGISGRLYVCKGEKTVITATGANNYTWTTGAQTSTLLITPSTTTIYTVTGSFTNTPCKIQQTVTVNVMPCLSVYSNPGGGIQVKVYPNPAKTELFYTINSGGKHRYTITDFNGTVIQTGDQSGNTVQLDISNFNPGIYNLTLTIGKLSKSSRFLVE